MHPLSDPARQDIARAIDSGSKLEAVRIYKSATGASLLESKNAVEAFMRGEAVSHANLADGSAQDEILDAIFANRKLEAVKLYRSATGSSLKEAKEFVEDLTGQLRETDAEQFTPHGKGCANSVLVCLALLLTGVIALLR